jgi:exosortase D (VPLPA-CTERM-specific)
MGAAKAEKGSSYSLLAWSTGAALSCGLLYIYWPVLSRLLVSLAESDDYSYGLLFPLVSGYIIYLKWPLIRQTAPRPSWLGLLIMAGGLFLYVVAELAAELFTTRVSFVVVLAGLVCLVGGVRLLRLLAFPLLLLFLMLPLPELITNKLTLPLQLVSSHLAAGFLGLLGVPVFQQGNIIDLGVRQLQIVKACSGLRYILPLLALGLIFGYFYQRRLWKVAVLLVSLVPLAIIANALRVTAMALYPAMLEGFWHGFSGWLIFLSCLGALAGLNWTLNYFWPSPSGSQPLPATSSEAVSSQQSAVSKGDISQPGPVPLLSPAEPQRIKLTPYLLGGLALVVVALPLTHRAASAPPVPLKQGFEGFPLQLGPWQGRITPVDPEMVKLTRSHAHLSADFFNPDHGLVSVWIAYYETQKKAGGFVHSPKGCLAATGWQFQKTGLYEISPGREVNYLLAEQMGSRMVVFYWYMQRGRWLTSEYHNKFFMGYDGLMRRRTDGALIRLITPAGDDVPGAQKRLAEFARLLAPVLQKFIPD